MMRCRSILFALSLCAATSACDEGGDDGTDSPPEAPSALTASAAAGGAHLTWQDNSDDETEFVVMRRLESETAFAEIGAVPFDTAQYHDASLEAGATYVYTVAATNDAGESESEPVTFTAP